MQRREGEVLAKRVYHYQKNVANGNSKLTWSHFKEEGYAKSTIYRHIRNSANSDEVSFKKNPGRTPVIATQDKLNSIQRLYEDNPSTSVATAAKELKMTKSYLGKIKLKKLGIKAKTRTTLSSPRTKRPARKYIKDQKKKNRASTYVHNSSPVSPISTQDEEQMVFREPMAQFDDWLQLACQTKGIVNPKAMCLATATKDGKPSNRMVLLREFNDAGFKFFTNYNSRKGHEIAENPYVAANFYWEPLARAVRIEGKVEKLSCEESTKYFHSIPIDSQIGAGISPQSRPIEDRQFLIERENELLKMYSDDKMTRPIQKPDSLGGYIIYPHMIEFWQGHDRVHERIRFRLPKSGEIPDGKLLHQGDNGWVMERLGP